MSFDGNLCDDSMSAKTAEEAVEMAKRMSGIFGNCINDGVSEKIRELKPGEVLKIKKPSLKYTIRIKRTK